MNIKKRKSESGQAMVEFALLLPVALLLLGAVIEFGWAFYNKLMIANLAREGARSGIVYLATIQPAVLEGKILNLAPAYAQDALDVNIAYSDDADVRAGDIIVDVSYTMKPLTPLVDAVAREGIPLHASCTMKMG